MKLSVPDNILQETTKCRNHFACLSSGSFEHPEECKIRLADGKNVLFLHAKGHIDCLYCLSFGFSRVCTCPTRYAIYQNDKK